jgi:hypothetical protein
MRIGEPKLPKQVVAGSLDVFGFGRRRQAIRHAATGAPGSAISSGRRGRGPRAPFDRVGRNSLAAHTQAHTQRMLQSSYDGEANDNHLAGTSREMRSG